jgi:hypothetical protein
MAIMNFRSLTRKPIVIVAFIGVGNMGKPMAAELCRELDFDAP